MKVNPKLKKNASKKGFTLIELIATIAIIGVLSAIAVNRYSTVIIEGKAAKETTVINTLEKSKDLYVAEETRTVDEIRQFNQKTSDERLSMIKPYIRLNGIEPSNVSLLEGTGKTSIDPGKLTTASYTTKSGTSTVTIAAEAGQAAALN